MVGTLKWRFQDDTGVTHKFHIKDSLLITDGTMQLLLPLHFASSCDDTNFDMEKFCSTQFWNRYILWWDKNGQYTKTIYNTRTLNVPTFYTAPSNQSFISYSAKFEPSDDVAKENVVFELQSEEEDEVNGIQELSKEIKDIDIQQVDKKLQQTLLKPEDGCSVETNKDDNVSLDYNCVTASTRDAEFMHWHYCLGHMNYKKMKRLAVLGYLPQRFSKVDVKCKYKIYQLSKQV